MMGRKQKRRQAGPFREGKQWEQVHGAGMRFCGGSRQTHSMRVGSLRRKKWERRLSRWAYLGSVRTPCLEGVIVSRTLGTRNVFEKGNGMMNRSSENMNLLMGCSVLELREVRGRKTSLMSRPWQLE